MTQNKSQRSPLEFFFSLGDKVTKGDPRKKADFDYYMLWVMFFAFSTVLVSNIVDFIKNLDFAKLGWGFVMFAILWFQYYTLKTAREARKYNKLVPNKNEVEKVESPGDMIKGFEKIEENIKKMVNEDKEIIISLNESKKETKLCLLEKIQELPNLFTLNKFSYKNEKEVKDA